MIKYSNIFIYFSLLLLISLLMACASAPEDNEDKYWHIIAQQHMHNGSQYNQRQQFNQAVIQFVSALNTYRRFNDVEGELNSRINLAKVSISLHKLVLAKQHIGEAQILIDNHGMNDKTVYLDIMRSSLSIKQGDLEKASELLETYTTNKSLPQDVQSALLVNKIRLTLLKRGEVLPLLQQLEKIAKNHPKYESRLWRFRAQYAHSQQQFANSDKYYIQALSHYRANANSMGVMMLLGEWGANLLERGEWQAARVRYHDMYNTALSLKQRHQLSTALNGLVRVYKQTGKTKKLHWARQQLKKLKH